MPMPHLTKFIANGSFLPVVCKTIHTLGSLLLLSWSKTCRWPNLFLIWTS